MKRPKHQNKHIEQAVSYAESKGWRFVSPGHSAHVWGRLFCAQADRSGCRVSVNSTPRVPEHHAQNIRKIVDSCPHDEGGVNEDL